MPESWFFSLDLKLDECLKPGSSAVSLLMSQDTCRLAGREPRLDRSASVSVKPCRRNHRHQTKITASSRLQGKCLVAGAHRFAVGGGGEAGLGGALPAVLAADVGALAGHGGAARRHEAAAGGAQVSKTDAEQDAQTRDVLG